jgi:hypothetical protein
VARQQVLDLGGVGAPPTMNMLVLRSTTGTFPAASVPVV